MEIVSEFDNKFKDIIVENAEFSVKMLDLCRDQKEADMLLSNTIPIKEKDHQFRAYPIIDEALDTENIKFVAHDFSQQILRDSLVTSDDQEVWFSWVTSWEVVKVMYYF